VPECQKLKMVGYTSMALNPLQQQFGTAGVEEVKSLWDQKTVTLVL